MSAMCEIHPYCRLLPGMDVETFEALCAEIKANGLKEPIIKDKEGRIVDGRHRY